VQHSVQFVYWSTDDYKSHTVITCYAAEDEETVGSPFNRQDAQDLEEVRREAEPAQGRSPLPLNLRRSQLLQQRRCARYRIHGGGGGVPRVHRGRERDAGHRGSHALHHTTRCDDARRPRHTRPTNVGVKLGL
jgi:hypothetical protein